MASEVGEGTCKWFHASGLWCACMGERRMDVRLSKQGVETRAVWVRWRAS